MPIWQRAYLATCAALCGFAMSYGVCEYAGWRRLIYAPIGDGWRLGYPPIGRDELGYFGLLAWGLGGALLSAAITLAICLAIRRPIADGVLRLAGAWAVTAVVLTGGFYTWGLWPF